MIPFLVPVLLSMQVTAASLVPPVVGVHLDCEDGTRLAATFFNPNSGPGRVELRFNGRAKKMVLPQLPSADGGRYGRPKLELWTHGPGATLTRAGTPTTCSISRK
jgi:membrane-bound inhibitor of C-type lysozyme